MIDILTAARNYCMAGWRVIPIQPRGKIPLIKDWINQATTDPDQVTKWLTTWPQANIGIVAKGSQLLFMDVDLHKPQAYDNMLQIIDTLNLPDTLTVSTPSGGLHKYFQYQNNNIKDCIGKLAVGIDIRAEGQVVAPPSVGANGILYIFQNYGHPVAWAPTALIDAIKATQQPPPPDSAPAISDDEIDHDATARNAARYTDRVDQATEGNRHKAAFKLACRLTQGFASKPNIARQLLQQWNARNPVPLNAEQLDKCIRDAGKYATEHRGKYAQRIRPDPEDILPHKPPQQAPQSTITPESAPVIATEQQPLLAPPESAPCLSIWYPQSMSAAELANYTDVRQWIIPGVIPAASISVVYGKPKSLKSMLVLDWLLRCAIGEYGVKRRVAWLDVDNGKAIMQERLYAMCAGMGIDPRQIDFRILCFPTPTPNLDRADVIAELDEFCRYARTELMAIDNLLRVSGIADENSAEIDRPLRALRAISERRGTAFLPVHHARKGMTGQDNSGDSLRGHSSIAAAVDATHLVTRKGKRLDVTNNQARHSPVPRRLYEFAYEHKQGTTILSKAAMTLLEDGDQDATEAVAIYDSMDMATNIINLLSDYLPCAVSNIHAVMGRRRCEVDATLIRLETAGRIERHDIKAFSGRNKVHVKLIPQIKKPDQS